jgi:hypothetical protein
MGQYHSNTGHLAMGWPVPFLRKESNMATDLKPETTFLEAKASWTVRYATPAGFSCMLTLRGENGKDLLEKADLALAYLADHQYLPDTSFRKNGNGESKHCPIHQIDMKHREKDGKTWYSHKTDTGWCYGIKPREAGNHG